MSGLLEMEKKLSLAGEGIAQVSEDPSRVEELCVPNTMFFPKARPTPQVDVQEASCSSGLYHFFVIQFLSGTG